MSIQSLFRRKSVEQIQKDAASGLSEHEGTGLHRTLGVVDLTAFGIAAIIGAGIFSTIGKAAFDGGPAVVFLFIFTAIACGFAAFCYAELASMIPVSGSAYTYTYATFGELVAWIIGWDLLLEYAIGNIAVAISWSDYFTSLVHGYGLKIPDFLTMDFLSAWRGFEEITQQLASGMTLESLGEVKEMEAALTGFHVWQDAPKIAGLRLICDLPALMIVVLVTCLVYVGIKESKLVSNLMVALKLSVIFFVIVLGSFYVKPENWTPFMPNGFGGVMQGIAAVFFAYIGFDAISTTAEECKNPQRDLPRSMIYSLLICTVLYIAIALVLTGMVSYERLNVGDPLAFVFSDLNMNWIAGIIAVSAVIAMATVLLVFQIGQPRIWMTISRDGLLPKIFSSIHPRFKTPWFSTIVAGFLVAVPALFLNLSEVTELTSIGTLFAFVLVCCGVLVLDGNKAIERKFKTPYVNSKYIAPIMFAVFWSVMIYYQFDAFKNFFDFNVNREELFNKIPLAVFVFLSTALVVTCYFKSFSLIPVLGILSCGYLMTGLGWENWLRFIIWLAIGLVVYFCYGFWHSKLGKDLKIGRA